MKKSICVILLIITVLSQQSIIIKAENNTNVLAIKHTNYYGIGNSLKAQKSEDVNAEINFLDLNENKIQIVGCVDNKQFELIGNIKDDSIVSINDSKNNFKVVSVYCFLDEIKMILSDEEDMYVINISNEFGIRDNLLYNPSWFTELLNAKCLEMKDKSEFLLNSGDNAIGHEKTYNRTFDIWGDIYTEYIVLNFYSFWPREKSSAQDFKTSLNVKRKYTIMDQSIGSTQEWENSSLEVAGADVNYAADKGEFFESVQTYYEGDTYGSSKTTLGFWLAIPKTPFGITTEYQDYEVLSGSSQGYMSFNNKNSGSEKMVKHGVMWDSFDIHLVDVDDYFEAIIKVATQNTTGTRKGLKFKWCYIICSSGNNSGIGTPPYNKYSSFSNTLYYDVE